MVSMPPVARQRKDPGVFFGVNLPLVEFVFLQGEPSERFVTLAVDKARTAMGAHR